VLHKDNFFKAAERVRAHLQTHGSATVSQLREVVGASRRIVVPLLEKLDRDGVTKRQGDLRVLKPGIA
jgi:selenocysteine-specific elongation factor